METHQINALRQYLKDTAGERHPLKEHILADQGDYHKNFYMKSLCMMATLDGALGDEQVFLLQRLIAGAHCSYGIEEYIRQGRDMEDGDIKELMEEILQGDLAYSFLFDLMILHHIAPIQSQTATFLGEMAEGLRLKTDAVTFMAEVCNALLEGKLSGAYAREPEEATIKAMKPYLFLGEMSIQCVTDEKYYAWYPSLTVHSCDAVAMKGKKVYLENIISTEKIKFEDSLYVQIRGCYFKDFDDFVLKFVKVKKCVIIDSTFEDCCRTHNTEGSGSRIQSLLFDFGYVTARYTSMEIYGSSFVRCGGKNERIYGKSFSAIIGDDYTTIVKNCTFEECWHVFKMLPMGYWKDTNNGTLFTPETQNINNTITDSAGFQTTINSWEEAY